MSDLASDRPADLVVQLTRLAARVRRRLVLRHALRVAALTAPAPIALLFVAWGLTLLGVPVASAPLIAGLAASLWLVAAVAVAVLTPRPTPQVLATYDRLAGTDEALLSAWDFGPAAGDDPWLRRHCARAAELARQAGGGLGRLLPLRVPRVVPLAALACLLAAFLPWSPLWQGEAADPGIDASGRENIRAAAAALAEAADDLAEEESDDPELAAYRDDLQEALEDTADLLADPGEDRREFLEQLDQELRELEALAEQGARGMEIDEELLEQLLANADTAALGDALQRDDEQAAIEALRELAAALANAPPVQRERLAQALAAAAGNREGALAEALRAAAADPANAAEHLAQLQQALQNQAQREALAQRMGELAERLRGMGQQAPGAQGLQQLGQPALAGQPGLGGLPPGLGAQRLGAAPFAPPGPQGPMQPGMPRAGVPMAGVPGQPGAPLPPGAVQAPVPGMAPGMGMQPGGMGMGPGMGLGLVPGAGGGRGGSQAGDGSTTGTGGRAVNPGDGETATVDATRHAGGDAEVREVMGAPNFERAARERVAVQLAELQAQEAALIEEELPLARRQHVLRYFTALRQELTHDDD